ncbi:hypothetical protein HU200_033804 [Digitaria exilis]|uniref:RRM domain-containing protein n=1 Tax=Digitaria exilis TaxID=1010633 RepID=A0A835EMQ3_9POAL|nr:hypothetical protein HU200_033804 [Digitaria exilis]
MDPDASRGINFWKDPNAESCCICGEEAEAKHTELTCPYNYLAPASYVPCRARVAAWRESRSALSEHRWFLRRLVRVNSLPGSCRPVELARLFAEFGPLLMWHVAMDGTGACKGFACVVFERRQHADEAIDRLNCYSLGQNLPSNVSWRTKLSMAAKEERENESRKADEDDGEAKGVRGW